MGGNSFSGNIALVCPDCGTHLVNVASSGERYNCHDCDLRLVRDGDKFQMLRYGEVVGQMPVEDVEITVTWRVLELAHAG
jgi:hypothetical protein